jgi:hypothetical protein
MFSQNNGRGFVWVGPSAFCRKKKKCPKEPHPNLANVLRFYDQIGRRLSVFLSNCLGTPFLPSGCSAGDSEQPESSSPSTSQTQREPKSESTRQLFQDKWKRLYPWLTFDENDVRKFFKMS